MLTSMERRLQERCAELQRDIFRLQGAHHQDGYKSLEKHPVALPRHVPPHSTKTGGSSEQDDEGISSSETGQSLSPEPILILPQANTQKYRLNVTSETTTMKDEDEANAATIEEVIEELANIVSDAEREISVQNFSCISTELVQSDQMEKEIVPVNLLPQPPKKSRSLAHLLSNGGSDFDGSDYGLLMIPNRGSGALIPNINGDVGGTDSRASFFDDLDYHNETNKFGLRSNTFIRDDPVSPDVVNQSSTNREILNVIMDAREKDGGMQGLMMSAVQQSHTLHQQQQQHQQQQLQEPLQLVDCTTNNEGTLIPVPAPHKFSGVFFMTEMNTAQKYPKPDITAALEARRVTKNLDRMESYGSGIDSMIDIVMTETANKQLAKSVQQQILLTGSNSTRYQFNSKAAMVATSSQLIRGGGNASSNGAGSKLTDLASGLY